VSPVPGIPGVVLAVALLGCNLVSATGALWVADALWAADALAQRTAPRPSTTNQSLEILMDQAPLGDVVEAIARRTGNHYIYESPLPGRVTVAVPSRVSAAEATQILNAVLLLKGMVAIPIAENQHKIVRWERMAASAPYTEAPLSPEAEHSITTRLVLQHADPIIVARTLQPMLQASGHVIPYPPANSLIFAGTENRIHRLIELARLMDASFHETLIVLRLRYRDAGAIKKQLEAMLRETPRSGKRPSTVDLQIDSRTNALILSGSQTEIAKLRGWIERIDIPAAGSGELHVVRLIHRDPEDLSQLLSGFAQAGTPASSNASDVANAGPLTGRDYTVVAHPETRSLIIRSDRETFDSLAQVISKLDREPRMVRVEIKIYEIATEDNLGLGFGGAIPFIEATDTKIYGALINPEVLPLEIPGVIPVSGVLGAPLVQYSGADAIPGLGISFIARESSSEIRLLQEPTMTLEVGEESELFIGDTIPIPVGTENAANLNIGTTLTTTFNREDVGTLIRVKAILNSDDSLQLELHLENQLVRGGDFATGPILSNRTIDTSFTAGFGRRMIIAGISGETRGTIGSSVPFLSQIPFLGRLTKASLDTHRKIYMFISVQAQLLPTSEERQASVAALTRAVERLDLEVEPLTGARYAVRAASYYTRNTAEAVEQLLLEEIDPLPMLIVEHQTDEGVRFDLFVLGLDTIAGVAEVALTLEQSGMAPVIVPLVRH
jgi:general secretion pathway protein D